MGVNRWQLLAGVCQRKADPAEPACQQVIGAETIGIEVELDEGLGVYWRGEHLRVGAARQGVTGG